MDFYFQNFKKKEGKEDKKKINVEEMWNAISRIVSDMENNPNKKPPISRKLLHELEVKFITKEDVKNFEGCSICLEGYKVDEQIFVLPCGHKFHKKCLTKWFSANNSCPYCRKEFQTDDSEYEESKKSKEYKEERRKEVMSSIYM